MVLGGQDAVGEVALAGQIDVGELVFQVQVALHFGLAVSCAAGLHLMANNYLLFINYQFTAGSLAS